MKTILMNSLWQKFRTSFLLMHSIHMSYPCKKKPLLSKRRKKEKLRRLIWLETLFYFFPYLKCLITVRMQEIRTNPIFNEDL